MSRLYTISSSEISLNFLDCIVVLLDNLKSPFFRDQFLLYQRNCYYWFPKYHINKVAIPCKIHKLYKNEFRIIEIQNIVINLCNINIFQTFRLNQE